MILLILILRRVRFEAPLEAQLGTRAFYSLALRAADSAAPGPGASND